MNKKFSICIPITGSLLKIILYSIKKLNKINKTDFISIPHINILSGNYKNEKELKKKFKSIHINKRVPIKSLGVGIFIAKKNIFYLRFEISNYIVNIRKKVLKKINIKSKEIDYTASNILWIPKSTLSISDLDNFKTFKSINCVKKNFSSDSFLPNKLILMDVTSTEKIISINKISKE